MPSSLLALFDDIASVLDDVAALTKVTAHKTAGVLGDDLALNAQQVAGVNAERELPVVWAVAKGSSLNKAILVPAALGISAFIPWAVAPLLMIGGAFLCYEGAEKVMHKLLHRDDEETRLAQLKAALSDPDVDVVSIERDKIRGAVRTDFVLSAEIVAIALGIVASEPFVTQLAVLVSISALMTVGVYGLVAGIVKLDDLGLWLTRGADPTRPAPTLRARLGFAILRAAPYLMKLLAVVGTVAMFLVGGGILSHGVPSFLPWAMALFPQTPFVNAVVPTLLDALVGVLAGLLVLGVVTTFKRLRR